MLLQLQKYDIRLQYTPGKEMYIAYSLSRAYLKDLPNDNESDIEGVNMLSDLPISEQRISEIQQYMLNDEQMQELKEVIQNGWPNRKYDVPPSAMIYFDVRKYDMFHISVCNPLLVNSSMANKALHVLYVNSLLLLYEKSEYA
jgi:hypothetical protein